MFLSLGIFSSLVVAAPLKSDIQIMAHIKKCIAVDDSLEEGPRGLMETIESFEWTISREELNEEHKVKARLTSKDSQVGEFQLILEPQLVAGSADDKLVYLIAEFTHSNKEMRLKHSLPIKIETDVYPTTGANVTTGHCEVKEKVGSLLFNIQAYP